MSTAAIIIIIIFETLLTAEFENPSPETYPTSLGFVN